MIRAIFLMNDQSITHACVTSREKENKIYVKIFLTGDVITLRTGTRPGGRWTDKVSFCGHLTFETGL